MATKIPKGWESTTAYRCYAKKLGRLVIKATYSSFNQTFAVSIWSADGQSELARLYEALKPLGGNTFDDYDAVTLRAVEHEAKAIIRSWLK